MTLPSASTASTRPTIQRPRSFLRKRIGSPRRRPSWANATIRPVLIVVDRRRPRVPRTVRAIGSSGGYRVSAMTEEQILSDTDAVIDDALSVIDAALARMMQRELVSSGEVADLLLDVRMLLTAESESEPA